MATKSDLFCGSKTIPNSLFTLTILVARPKITTRPDTGQMTKYSLVVPFFSATITLADCDLKTSEVEIKASTNVESTSEKLPQGFPTST